MIILFLIFNTSWKRQCFQYAVIYYSKELFLPCIWIIYRLKSCFVFSVGKTSWSLFTVITFLGSLSSGGLVSVRLWLGFPSGTSGEESTCPRRRLKGHKFHPYVGKTPGRRRCQPAPLFLPGKFHGQRSLVGYNPWACQESDTTEQLNTHTQTIGQWPKERISRLGKRVASYIQICEHSHS